MRRNNTSSTVYFVDVDNTLFDVESFKNEVFPRVSRALGKSDDFLWQLYSQSKLKKQGKASMGEVFKLAGKKLKIDSLQVERVFYENVNFQNYLFPGALDFLKTLKKRGAVILVTQDPECSDFCFRSEKEKSTFQQRKIKQSGLLNLITSQNVWVLQDKTSKKLGAT